MAFPSNECQFRAVSGGLTDFVVAGPVTGFFTPDQCTQPPIIDGQAYYWRAESDDLAQHEFFSGIYTQATATVSRTVILQSSNGNAIVNFSNAPRVRLVMASQELLAVVPNVPLTSSSPGVPFQTAFDTFGNMYICYAPNMWAKFMNFFATSHDITMLFAGNSTLTAHGDITSEDPATTAWVNAVIANGGTVSGSRRALVNALIIGLKSDSIFSKLDRLWMLAAENEASALTDMVSLVLATAVNSPTFTTDRGYTSVDGSTSIYIDSNTILSTLSVYAQNAAHISAWSVTNNATANIDTLLGGNDGSNDTSIDFTSAGAVIARINESFNASVGTPGTFQGHWLLNRSGASASQLYQNASLFASPNTTSTGSTIKNTFILAYNNNSAIQFGTPNQVAMASMGGNLSSTDTTNFYNRLRTYMTAVGVP